MTFPVNVRKVIFKNGKARCLLCKRKWEDGWMLECNHIAPTFENGSNHPDNGNLLCRECHAYWHENNSRNAFRLGYTKKARQHAYAARMIRQRIKLNGLRRRGFE